jgi:uncharacterized phiE125 gp8 family phage protein
MNWTKLKRTVAPTASVVTVEDVKRHLNIAHSDEDATIAILIDVATDSIEGPNGVGLALVDQTWRMSLDRLSRSISVPLHPVKAIQSIIVDGVALDPASYYVDIDQRPAVIRINDAGPQGQALCAQPGGVKIEFTAGYDDAPADLKHVIRLLVGHYYMHREATSEATIREIPLAVASILQRYAGF